MSSKNLAISNHSIYQNNHYLHLTLSGKVPVYATQSIDISSNKLAQKLCFPISETSEPGLFDFINDIEKQAEKLLINLPDNILSKLPLSIGNRIREYRIKPQGSLLRPTYRPAENMCSNKIAWINAKENVEMYNWSGSTIHHCSELSAGEYQFIIKAATIYLGEHGKLDGVIANCVVRINSLRCRAHEKSGLIWDFDSNLPAKSLTTDYDNNEICGNDSSALVHEDMLNSTAAETADIETNIPKKRGRKPKNALKLSTSTSNPDSFIY